MPRSTIFSADARCASLHAWNGQRSASGRTVKRYLADHRWEPIRVYTLRERATVDAPLRRVRQTFDLHEVEEWLGRDVWKLR